MHQFNLEALFLQAAVLLLPSDDIALDTCFWEKLNQEEL